MEYAANARRATTRTIPPPSATHCHRPRIGPGATTPSRREHDVVLGPDDGVQAVDELLRVEPELLGVVTQEGASVRRPRKRLEAFVLERHQVLGADLGIGLDLIDAETEPDALFAQRGADACHRPTGFYGFYPLRRVLVSTTTKSLPVIRFRSCRPSSLKCEFEAPWTYHSVPLSATMIP